MKFTNEWRKSSKSGANGQCVEVRLVDGNVEVRNSNRPEAGSVLFTGTEWDAFTRGVENKEFEI